jgi:hypothetical protein
MKRFALTFAALHLLFACSSNYHLNKAIKKGYRCEEISDTIQITSIDSIPVIVHDSIVWEKILVQKDTIIRYKQSIVPKTRLEIRLDKHKFSDSLKTIRRMYSNSLKADVKMHRDSLKADVKLIKQKTRQNKKSQNLFLFGLVTGVILTIIIRYAINQALKKFT